jgi:diguanylate cyclase (GGDEF)-like protein
MVPSVQPAESSSPAHWRRQLPLLALMTGLSVLLNGLPLPLFYGVQILLGSVLPVLALLLWRQWWGVAIGAVASLQTWRLWGHPWAVVIFTLELVWLHWALKRRRARTAATHANLEDDQSAVVLYAIGYWLLVGAPLVLLFYGLVLGMDAANVAVVAVKQSFNGVLNTVLAYGTLTALQLWQRRHQRGPGLSLRGLILSLALLAITLPTLVISLTASHQLEQAIQTGELHTLQTVNLAVSQAGPDPETLNLLMQQLGDTVAYRRIGGNGRMLSSDPTLFQRLDGLFEDGGRSHVRVPELALLVPRDQQPTLQRWVRGYWSYSRHYSSTAMGRPQTTMVQVVAPARSTVLALQSQSAVLLGVALAVLLLGALGIHSVGERLEAEFQRITRPLKGKSTWMVPLPLSDVRELRQVAVMINHRMRQVNRLSLNLRASNRQLRHSQQELEQLLSRDPLTGCGNRRSLEQRLREEWHRSRSSREPCCCLWIEVDGFQALRQLVGGAATDTLLRSIAQALRERLRVTDHLFRWGGEQFVVIATGCYPEDGRQLASSLQSAVEAMYLSPGDRAEHHADEIRVSVSVGISLLDGSGSEAAGRAADTDRVLQQAREALARAQRRGAGQLAVSDEPG